MGIAMVKNPDEIECILQFTMKLKDWKQIRETLRTNMAHTELQIIDEISELVDQLEKTFYIDA